MTNIEKSWNNLQEWLGNVGKIICIKIMSLAEYFSVLAKMWKVTKKFIDEFDLSLLATAELWQKTWKKGSF